MKISDYLKLIRVDHLTTVLLLYLIGIALAFKTFNTIDFKVIIGALSILLSYGGVYTFNDILDSESDKKHYVKYKRERPIPKGDVKIKDAKKIFLIHIITGYILALITDFYFFISILILTIINYFYSGLKLKTHFLTSMFILGLLQSIKVLAGWFCVTKEFSSIPVFILLSIALVYSFIMSIYKKERFKNTKHYITYQPAMLSLTLVFLGLSFTYTRFAISLIFFFIIFAPILVVYLLSIRKMSISDMFSRGILVMPTAFTILLISLLLF